MPMPLFMFNRSKKNLAMVEDEHKHKKGKIHLEMGLNDVFLSNDPEEVIKVVMNADSMDDLHSLSFMDDAMYFLPEDEESLSIIKSCIIDLYNREYKKRGHWGNK